MIRCPRDDNELTKLADSPEMILQCGDCPSAAVDGKVSTSPESPYGQRWTKWIKPVILAALLVALDEISVFAMLAGAILLFYYLPKTLKAEKYACCRKERLIRFGIYATAVCISMAMVPINKRLARDRAEQIIAAAEKYKADQGYYPGRLAELEPKYIASVPDKARIGLSDRGFRYMASDNSHTLMYVSMPPFGRSTYNFERHTWGFID